MMWPGGKLDRSSRLFGVHLQTAAPGPVLLFYPKEAKVQHIHSSILSSAPAGGYRLRALGESRRRIQKHGFIHIGENSDILVRLFSGYPTKRRHISKAGLTVGLE